MWQYLFQVTLALCLLYIPYALLLHKETFFRFNRSYLLLAAGISVILPLLPRWLVVQDPVAFTLPEVQIGVNAASASALKTGVSSVDWLALLTFAYCCVAMFFLLRMGKDLFAIHRMYREGVRRTMNNAILVVHPDARSPFSFFNCVFISPELEDDTSALRHVLGHELQHVRGRHSVDVLVIEVFCALFWISPPVYLYRRALRNVHEYLADHFVSDDERVDYAELLVSQAYQGLRLSLSNQFFQSQLKARIIMMMKQPSQAKQQWKYLLAIPVLCISIALFSFRNQEIEPQSAWSSDLAGQHDSIPPGKKTADDIEFFQVVEEMPRFPGCEDVADMKERYNCARKKLLEYVYTNIIYPENARDQGINGVSIARFVVQPDGSISNVETVRAIGGGCDEEVVRVLKSMNEMDQAWVPGRQRGKAVAVQFTVPVSFKLDNAKGKSENPDKSTDVVVTSRATNQGQVYQVVEEMPRFPGCEESGLSDIELTACATNKLLQYIAANLKYPAEARAKKIEGREIVEFVVEPNGLISSVKSVKSLGYGCDREIIRVIESMNSMEQRWIPGMQDGKPVAVKLTLPVMYKL